MNKIIHVPAHNRPVYEDVTTTVPSGEKRKKGLFGKVVDVMKQVTERRQTGISDCQVDGERLAAELGAAVEQLNKDGYEVVCISPITSGNYKWNYNLCGTNKWGYGYGYGFSYTSGLVVIARKIPI